MKKHMQTYYVSTVFLLILTFTETNGANYYFSDKTGEDSRSYSEAQYPETPWKTVDKLNQIFSFLQPGDSVLFKNDESYWGTIEITKSGSEDNPIYIGTYGQGKKAEITGLSLLSHWQSHTQNVYSAQLSPKLSELSVLIIDDNPFPLGRHPNGTAPNKGYLPITSFESNNKLIISEDLAKESNWSAGELVMRKNHWIIDRQPIIGQNDTELIYRSTSSYKPRQGYGFFIQNHINTLDQFGEWYYDKHTGKVYIYSGNNDIANLKIHYANKENLLTTLTNTRHIVINGLKFTGANKHNILLKGGDNIQIQNCEVIFSGEDGIHSNNVSRLRVETCMIQHSYNTGIYAGPGNANGVIQGNEIDNTYMFPGMGLSGDNKGFGIFSAAEADTIASNHITNSGYTGISFRGNHTIIKNNYIDNFCLVKNDGAGIYTYSGSKNTDFVGRQVVNNIIINGKGVKEGTHLTSKMDFAPAEGIYMDDNASGVEIIGNTVANVSSKSLYLHNARDIVVKNNIFYNAQYQIYIKNDNLGAAVRNLQITQNKAVCISPNQIVLAVLMDDMDPSTFGMIDDNQYFYSGSDGFIFYSEYINEANDKIKRHFNMRSWTINYPFDQNSTGTQFGKQINIIKHAENQKLLEKDSFNGNPRFTGQNCSLAWVDDIDNRKLAVEYQGTSSFLKIKIGAVALNQKYALKLKVKSQKSSDLEFFIRHNQAPYQKLSFSKNIMISQENNEYTVILEPLIATEDAAILIHNYDRNFSMTIEDLDFSKVMAAPSPKTPLVHLFSNPSHQNNSIFLKGDYVDLENNPYSGALNLKPFSSILLMEK